VLQHPSVYTSLGLRAPPSSYSPAILDEYCASFTILDYKTGLCYNWQMMVVMAWLPSCSISAS
jgi:hypothetical protein